MAMEYGLSPFEWGIAEKMFALNLLGVDLKNFMEEG